MQTPPNSTGASPSINHRRPFARSGGARRVWRKSSLAAFACATGLVTFAAPFPSRAATTVFDDNFNRDDTDGLGPNWSFANGGQLDTNGQQARWLSGTNTMYYLAGHTGAYTHTTLKVDVLNLGSTGFQSVALLLGQPDSPSADGLFLQIVAENVTSNFTRIELDTGANQTDATKWTTPTSIFTPTPFSSARITASAVDVDTIRIGIDSNFDGVDEQSFTRDLNLGAMGFGNRMGLSINGGAMRADNFSASIITPVNVNWNVAGGGTWDITSNNWIGGSLHPTKYFNTDNAFFSNPAGGTITLAGGANALAIAPGSTTVNAASGTYTFVGSGITSGTLTKAGAGKLILANPNTFTGITTVQNAGSTADMGADAHLTLNNVSGNALSGDLHIGIASALSGNVAKVNLARSNQIADNRVIYFDSPVARYAYLSLRGNSETVAGIVSNSSGGVIENGNYTGAINTTGTLALAPPVGVTHTFTGIIRDADTGGGTGKLNITINGPGTQVLGAGGTYTYTGATAVNGGTLRIDGSIASSSGVAVTAAGAKFQAGSTQLIKSLNIANGASAELVATTLSVLTIGDNVNTTPFVLGGSASAVNLHKNIVIIDYPSASPKTAVRSAIQSANYTTNIWNGVGIGAAEIAVSQSVPPQLAVGYAESTDLIGGGVGTMDFGGSVSADVDATTLIIRTTLSGDADLDGSVNLNDLIRLANNYGAASGKHWSDGDFDYSGGVDLNDLIRLANNYGSTFVAGEVIPSASDSFQADMAAVFDGAAVPTAVPEPGTLGFAVISAAGKLLRRRRTAEAG